MNLLIDPDAHPVIGHRGMAAAAPENTLEAMDLAFRYGADAVEFDLRLTADGEVVVMHDARVERTTDGEGEVAALPLAQLAELDAGARFKAGTVEGRLPPPTIDAEGVTFPEYRDQSNRARPRHVIPTFREVLERFPDRHLLIEIKAHAAAPAARKLIEKFGAENRCMVDSYSEVALEAFRGSRIPTGAAKEGVTRLLAAFFLRQNPGVQYHGMCIPPSFNRIPLPMRILSKIARGNRKTLHVWTINRPKEARSLWKSGVNGIITDDVRTILAERAKL